MQQRALCSSFDQVSSGLGRRFSALGWASVVALGLGIPSTGVLAQANPPQPPPPPSINSCWTEFIGFLNECAQFSRTTGPDGDVIIDVDGWSTCVAAARDGLTACLAQVPLPTPRPTRLSCRFDLIQRMKACYGFTSPWITNPEQPVGPSIPADPQQNFALKACLAAARDAYAKCLTQVEGPKVIAELSPSAVVVQPDQKYLTLSLRLYRTGPEVIAKRVGISIDMPGANESVPWTASEWASEMSTICDDQPVVSDQTPVGQAMTTGGLAPRDITINLPIDPVDARVDGFILTHRFENDSSEVLAIAPVWVSINWHWADLNRDQTFSADDTMLAIEAFFAGRFDEAGLQGLIYYIDANRCR
jgi:hypothetical protein